MSTRLALIEDDPLMRASLSAALSAMPDIEVVTSTDSPQELLATVKKHRVDAVVCDLHIGDGPSGIEVAHAARRIHPAIGVVFLTELAHPRISKPEWTDLPPGAGFLTKSKLTSLNDLIEALEAVLTVDPENPPRHDKSGGGVWDDLSKAQIEVLGLIAQGMSNTDIAKHRGTQVRAVEALISRTFDQLDIDTPGTDGNRRVLAARTFLLASRESNPAG